ncbi:MAG: glycosyltransferase family 4 protein [Chloroflexi bacterium]|nr:glycosyltransferase family 4 protein [Chloroflexota bacterium]
MNRRACVVSQRQYPGDSRLTAQVRSLNEAGYAVDMICMRGNGPSPFRSVEDGVVIHRIPSMERRRAGKVRYVAEYVTFFLPALLLLTVLQFVRGYRVVLVTNLPDGLLFSAIVPRLVGAKVLFDVRECTPEMFMDRFGAAPGSRIVRLMTAIEQACLRFADATVTCTEQMRQALIGRGGNPVKVSIMLNMPADTIQREPARLPDPQDEALDEFRIVTHGTVIQRYGHELLIEAMDEVVAQVPQARLKIFGRGESLPRLQERIAQLGLHGHVTLAGFVSNDELLSGLRRAHCGVVPLLRNPESDLVHTYKMFEYIHLGIPLVISRTTAVAASFGEDSVCFFEPNDAHALAQALISMARSPQKRYDLARNALRTYEVYNPAQQRIQFAALVARLTRTPAPAVPFEVGHGK